VEFSRRRVAGEDAVFFAHSFVVSCQWSVVETASYGWGSFTFAR
jgi:hypothetical protein